MTETATRVEPHELALQRAHKVIQAYDLKDVLAKHEQAIEQYMEARRLHVETKRLHQDAVDRVDEVQLEALLEMEQDPEYVPGRNAEQRKQQAEAFLAKHAGVAAAKNRRKHLGLAADRAGLDVDHAKARVGHLELQIAARRTELDLIASFARGAS